MTGRRSGSPSDVRSPRAGGATVLLDTNLLMLRWGSSGALREAVLAQVPGATIVVPSLVDAELDRVERRGPGTTAGARGLADGFPRVRSGLAGDSDLVAVAVSLRAWVATADRALRARLLRAGLRVLYPRRGGQLVRFEAPPRRPRSPSGQRL